MSKIAATVATIVALTDAQYTAPAPNGYAPHQPAYQGAAYAHQQPSYQKQHAYGYTPEFKKPSAMIDPSYSKFLLSNFQQCKQHKCDVLGRGYSSDVKESISTLGAYTSCITACAAEQTLRATIDFKNSLSKYFDIGFAQLVLARKYVSGEGEYDVLGEATAIKDSCCLPNDYFTTWDRIMIPVVLTVNDNGAFDIDGEGDAAEVDALSRWVSVTTYINVCTTDATELGWLAHTQIECMESVVEYLQLLQRNVGHLILAPKSEQLAPNGACNEDLQSNPRAASFKDDVCVATECKINGQKVEVDEPLVKPIIASDHYYQSCPSDMAKYGDEEFEIMYKRVKKMDLKYYTVTAGLPSLSTTAKTKEEITAAIIAGDAKALGHCEFDGKLADEDQHLKDDEWTTVHTFTAENVVAARVCPYGGLFEYCNMRQYASFLQSQLFNNDACQVVDMRDAKHDVQQYYGTLACLYKITTLKCDCMEAVLNCYEHKVAHVEPLSQTIGKAASILCGFLLCQRPSVYSLFGGQSAVEKSNIMRELLSQAGVASAGTSSIPPATFAFLTFGVGMVAFVVTKRITKPSSTVSTEDGYRSLI